jgi:hypothetical protein
VEYENTFDCGDAVFIIFTDSVAENDLSAHHSESCDSAVIYGDPDKVGIVSAAVHLFMGMIPLGLTLSQQAIIDNHPELSPEMILEKFGVFFSALFLGGTYQELLDAGHVVELSGVDEDGNAWSRPSITRCSLEVSL